MDDLLTTTLGGYQNATRRPRYGIGRREPYVVSQVHAAAATRNLPPEALAGIDVKIAKSEQPLLDAAGLLHRDWFKHLLYAPGFYTGYGVKTLPGVREAIEQGQYGSVPGEIARVAKALAREAAWLDSITKDIRRLK